MDETAEQHPILVEFAAGPGLRQVALTPAEALERSGRAIDDAMGVIREMACRVRDTVESLARRPSSVEVTFGIKFDWSAGVVVAKAGTEASINVKLAWDSTDQP